MSKTRKRRTGQCVYCGYEGPVTREHVPPKNLFPSPAPSNLITVPCCRVCNNKASRDDEYFRMVISFRADVADHPAAIQNLRAIFRGLRKPQKTGLRRAVVEKFVEHALVTPAGLYLGTVGTYEVDMDRIYSVAKRIAQGLFFRARGVRLGEDSEVIAWFGEKINEFPTKLLRTLAATEPETFGDHVFEYRVVFASDHPNVSLWLLEFYDAVSVACATAPRARHASAPPCGGSSVA